MLTKAQLIRILVVLAIVIGAFVGYSLYKQNKELERSRNIDKGFCSVDGYCK